MDNITLQIITQAHPTLRDSLLQQYKEINNRLPANVRLRFSSVFRSPEEQHRIFLQRPKVTKADSWQSIHNYGLAFDIVILYDKNGDGTSGIYKVIFDKFNKDWVQVATYFKSKGWEWGGDWKRFKDAPHFQKSQLGWKELKAKIDSGNIIVDNGIKYPKL